VTVVRSIPACMGVALLPPNVRIIDEGTKVGILEAIKKAVEHRTRLMYCIRELRIVECAEK
jgi:hypothetical protein